MAVEATKREWAVRSKLQNCINRSCDRTKTRLARAVLHLISLIKEEKLQEILDARIGGEVRKRESLLPREAWSEAEWEEETNHERGYREESLVGHPPSLRPKKVNGWNARVKAKIPTSPCFEGLVEEKRFGDDIVVPPTKDPGRL